jgi:hypothetical protein
MRKLFLFLLITIVSCTGHKSGIDKTLISDSASNDSMINNLAGDWVNLKYLQSIQKTKSPKISQNEGGEYSYIRFSSDTALFIFGFHEALDLKVKFEGNNNFYCVGFNNDTIRMIVSNDKLTVVHRGAKETFLKYNMRLPYDDFGIRLLNKEIFSGVYRDIDSPNHIVTFTDDGLVKGFLDFNSYVVDPDYADAGCNFDIIYLRKIPKDRFKYTWTFSKDTLKIFNLDCAVYDSAENMCLETKIGQLQYRLIKK